MNIVSLLCICFIIFTFVNSCDIQKLKETAKKIEQKITVNLEEARVYIVDNYEKNEDLVKEKIDEVIKDNENNVKKIGEKFRNTERKIRNFFGGAVENLYERVKVKTLDVKNTMYDWWSYGKGVLLGKENEAKLNNNADALQKESKPNIVVTILDNIRRRVDDIFSFEKDENEKKTKNLYHRIKNSLVKVKDGAVSVKNYVIGSDIESAKAIFGDKINFTLHENNSKAINEAVVKPLLPRDSKTEMQKRWENIINRSLNKYNCCDNLKDAYEKEKELLDSTRTKIVNNINQVKDASKVVTNDINTISKAAAETAKNDYTKSNLESNYFM